MVFTSILAHFNKGIELLAGYIKPQAIAMSAVHATDSGVKTCNEANFQEIVMESGREAFILFYAKTCPHCVRVVPVWEQFGEKLKTEEVDVVKIDVSENIYPQEDFKVDRIPTIYWKFAAAYRKPIKYSGPVSIDELIKFAAERSSKELKAYDRKGKVKGN